MPYETCQQTVNNIINVPKGAILQFSLASTLNGGWNLEELDICDFL